MTSQTSPRALAKARARAKADTHIERLVIESLMAHKHGRRWVWLQLEFAQMFNGDENLDPHYMAFAKGRRNTGLKLLAAVTSYTPKAYITMTQENTSVALEDNEDDGRTDSPSDGSPPADEYDPLRD